MAKSRRKKIALLTILSSFVVAAGALVVTLGTKEGKMFRSSAGTEIPGTLNYSYTSSGHKTISSLKHSFKKTTSSGTDIYFYSENNNGIGTSLIATFGSSSYSSSYFTFTKDENGAEPFIFQNVTSLKIRTGSQSTAGAGFKIFTSQSAATASYEGTIGVSEEKTISEIAGATYIKVVPTSSSWLDIESVQLNYSCDPEASGKRLVGLHFGESKKTTYAVNAEFVAPTVYGDYVDGEEVLEPEVVDAEFSGYDMSKLGIQTVTATFQDKSAQYEIHVKPTEQSKLITYHGYGYQVGESHEPSYFLNVNDSVLPSYGEPGETLSFTPVFKNGFSYFDAYDSGYHVEEFVESSGVVSFTVPSYYDVDVVIVYDEVLTLDHMRVYEPKTEYKVGDSFVVPAVLGTYINPNGDEFEFPLQVTASNFSGFDSSDAVASQTITVSYPGIESIQYTISIAESVSYSIVGTYSFSYSSWQFKYQFKDDGTGKIYRWRNSTEEYTINFTYAQQGSKYVITIDSNTTRAMVSNYTNGYRPVKIDYDKIVSYVNDSPELDNDGNLNIDLWRYASSTHTSTNYTFTRDI